MPVIPADIGGDGGEQSFNVTDNILLFGMLWWQRKKLKPGVLFFIYILGYSLSQIIVFFWRDNEVLFLGLKQAQLTAIGTIIVAVAVFVWFFRRQKAAQAKLEQQQNQTGT